MEGVRFIGDLSPEYISDNFLNVMPKLLAWTPVMFEYPDECSANMAINLERATSTEAKWYLMQPYTRESILHLLDFDVPIPQKFLLMAPFPTLSRPNSDNSPNE